MRPTRILIAESAGFSPVALQTLRAGGAAVTTADLTRAGLMRALGSADVVWVRLRTRVDAALLARAPRLRFLVTATTGLDHIALDEAERRGIRVLSLRGQTDFLRGIHATAEHTLALTLALLRKLPGAVFHTTRGGWNRDLFRGNEIFGRTVGIVGWGRIGRMVQSLFEAFGANVLICDPYATDVPAPRLDLRELLRRSDIVTLHVNLCEQTRRMIGPAEFSSTRPGSWLINTSRGDIVDEDALLNSLCSGHLAGAALDVLCEEDAHGMESSPLVQYARVHNNLILTPHIGGCTFESMAATEEFLAERLIAALQEQLCAA
jgi:D-3-phosphoglycerate dehydrogenase